MGIQKLLLVALILSLVAACTSAPGDSRRPVSTLYCDNFLIYEICAQDLDDDGIVELVYFEDTYEVFLWREGADRRLPANLLMHRCAQQMDDDIINNTSELFFITDETNYIERADIKSALLFSYAGFMPRVMRCNAQFGTETPEPIDDEFDF